MLGSTRSCTTRTLAITAKALAMVELSVIIILLSCPRSGADLVVSQVGWAGWKDKPEPCAKREQSSSKQAHVQANNNPDAHAFVGVAINFFINVINLLLFGGV